MVSENPFIDMDVGLIVGVVPFLAARNTLCTPRIDQSAISPQPPVRRSGGAQEFFLTATPGPKSAPGKGLFRVNRATCCSWLRPAGAGGYRSIVFGGAG